MGKDSASSVLDPWCKAHQLDNLYVADTAFFVTSAAVNPTLTTVANAMRVGDHLKERLGGLNMLEREPSRTALAVASYRAAHQVLEGAGIFNDPLAVPILGAPPQSYLDNPEFHDARRGIRFFVAARARLAEDALKRGVDERDVRQLVVLGAGLDTFAYRNPFGDRLKVFEVDHPATQAWKRRRLQEAGIAVPDSLIYAPVDFEHQTLAEQLAEAGLDPSLRTFFTWLGVVPT